MPSTSPTSTSFALPTTSARTADGVTHIDLNFATEISKGSGSIFITDGAVQTVIDRSTGQPKLRVVGATFTKEVSLDQVHISGTHVLFDATGLPPGANLNVYMGAGTLLSGGKAYGAITAPGSVTIGTPAVETPTSLSATIAVDDKTLKAGADIKLTVTFSKAVSSLHSAAISADHATVKDVVHSTDKLTWTITLGASDSVESASNVLRLDMDQVVGADGTRGSGILTSAPYAVDTIVDAWLLPYLGINDEGPSDEDGITNGDTHYVSGLLVGEREADEHVELIINGRIIDKTRIKWFEVEDDWFWYYDAKDETGDAPRFMEGPNTVTARLVKADGHSSATVTKTVTIDTDAPEIVSAPTLPVDLSLPIVISFDQAMYWEDNVEVTKDIEVVDEFGNTSWISLNTSMLSADRKTLTLHPGDHDLATGNTYRLYLPYDLTDLAGNEYEGPAIQFTTAGPYQDKAAPRLLQTYIVNGDGIYGKGEVLEFRLRYSEQVKLDAGTELKLHLSNGKVATYMGLAKDGTEMVFTYTIGDGGDTRSLDTYRVESVVGNVHDNAGNVLQNSHIEYDGHLTTEQGYGAIVEIDTVAPPVPEAPRLASDSDSGSKEDLLTSDRTPTLAGSAAEAGAKVEIYEGDTLLGYSYADDDGGWSATVDAGKALADGAHQLSIRQVDAAGNRSAASPALALRIDAIAPAALSAPVPASDTGISDRDGITREIDNGLRGTGAEPFTEVRIMLGTTVVGAGTSDAEGHWTAHFISPLAEGVHTYTVRQVDAAGNLGAGSPPVSFTVDRTGPASAPPAPLLAAPSDTGASDHDGITRDSTPTFTGAGAMPNSEVALLMNEREVGRTVTDTAGGWSIAIGPADALSDGYYSVGLKQFDAAGNKSPYSASFDLRIDTAAASAPGRPRLAASSDSGISNSDAITNDTTPTFSGAGAEADATIVLFAGAREIGRASADSAGYWNLTVLDADKFTDGDHAITALQIDAAGNTSAASSAFSLVIDTAGPSLLSAATNRSAREFQLVFNEKVSFHPGGNFDLKDASSILSLFQNGSNNWYTTSGAAGGADSILNLKMPLTGMFNLTMNNDAIQDAAGNVALIGTRQWLIELLDGPSF